MNRYLVKGSPGIDSPYMWWSTISEGPVHLFADRAEAWTYLTHRVTDSCATCTRERAQAEVIMHNTDVYGSSAVTYHCPNGPFTWTSAEHRVSLGAPSHERGTALYHWYLPREQVTSYIQALLASDISKAQQLLVPRLVPDDM